MAKKACQQDERAETVVNSFGHADNSTTADFDTGIAHICESLDAVLQGSSGDDSAVELRRGVDVVIVVLEPDISEPQCLFWRQHAERDAGFHADTFDRVDHVRRPALDRGPLDCARPWPCRSARRRRLSLAALPQPHSRDPSGGWLAGRRRNVRSESSSRNLADNHQS